MAPVEQKPQYPFVIIHKIDLSLPGEQSAADPFRPVIIQKIDLSLPDVGYATAGAAAFDLYASLADAPDYQDGIALEPGTQRLISSGISIAIPSGYVGMVCPRSGLALKYGITVTNSPGLIDSDFRGLVQIICRNQGDSSFVIRHGDRIAQMMISPAPQFQMWFSDSLDETERGEGGFGSTGVR